jgi:putative tricarboxylic transport membrane protein
MFRMIAVSAALAALAAAGTTLAEDWKPSRPVEIVIPSSAGSPQDRMGRIMQKLLQDDRTIDVPLAAVNKSGGGGAVAYSYVAQHNGDGRFLLIHALSLFTNHITGASAIAHTDFTPLAVMGVEYVGVTVRPDSPIKSGKDLIDQLRKDPASLSIAIGTGLGNATHISFAQAMKAGGIDIKKLKTVVFNSPSEGVTALLGGHIDVVASAPSNVFQYVQAGKLRMLAIGAPQRLGGELAGVPAWKEMGINATFELWRGIAGPKGLSTAQIQFWDDAFARLVKTEEWRRDLEQSRVDNIYKNSTETARKWKSQYEEARAVLVELGLAK